MFEHVRSAVESYREQDNSSKQALQQLYASSPQEFCRAALAAMLKMIATPGYRYLLYLLRSVNLFPDALLEPAQCRWEQALEIARAVSAAGGAMVEDADNLLRRAVQMDADRAETVIRILELVEVLGLGKHVLPYQAELMGHPNCRVRSKAAPFIARHGKNALWITRMLRDPDPRVQANVVEVVWELEEDQARPLLETAALSRNNRVAANALLGLCRLGVVSAFPRLQAMASHPEPAFRISALWAIAQAADPRFVPFLESRFPAAEGKERMAIVRALSAIRKRMRDAEAAGAIRVCVCSARPRPDGSRVLRAALSSGAGADLASLRAADFAVWEDGRLVADYSISASPNPPLLIVGMVIPRLVDRTDPLRCAIESAMSDCLGLKRRQDLWWIQKYLSNEMGSDVDRDPAQPVSLAEMGLAGADTRKHQGYLTDEALIRRLIAAPGPREAAERRPSAAMERAAAWLARGTGVRHLLVFLDEPALADFGCVADRKALAQSLREMRVTVHAVVAAASDSGCAALREMLDGLGSGYLTVCPVSALAEAAVAEYARLLNRYEIVYRAQAEQGREGRLEVMSASGRGVQAFQVAG